MRYLLGLWPTVVLVGWLILFIPVVGLFVWVVAVGFTELVG